MASRLVLEFSADGKETLTLSYSYAKASATVANVKALGAAIVANNTIFQYPPLTLKAAKIVTTTETNYDISD